VHEFLSQSKTRSKKPNENASPCGPAACGLEYQLRDCNASPVDATLAVMPRRASVEPMPPRVGGPLPFVRGGLGFIRSPTEFLSAARKQHGDTFLLDAFGFQLLLTFSPTGLRCLYAAPERAASFTEATRTLIGFKVPSELLGGDMQLFHKLFTRERMPAYLDAVRDAVGEDIGALGRTGEIELFARAKLLIHRIGFRCWVGP